MCNKIEIPLDIEDVDVKNIEFTQHNEILISVESTVKGTPCHVCGKVITKLHGHGREIRLRHLPILNKNTYLSIKPNRYICENCDNHPTTTQKLSWYDERSSCTKAYENYILLMLINSTISDVSQKLDTHYDIIEGILNRLIEHKINWTEIKTLKTIGIDEIAIKKGHNHFYSIISSLEDKEKVVLLAVLPERKKEAIVEFFSSIPKYLRETVENICTDLHDGYISAATEVFGKNIHIIADRFHVAQLYRKAVDELRISEMRRLKQELSTTEYETIENPIWLIRKSPSELSDDEKKSCAYLQKYSPDLINAYLFSNELTAIFDKPLTPEQAREKINTWTHLVRVNKLTCFDAFLGTLENYMIPITNYFRNRLNSGFVEGLNNKIKVIKRRCYGIYNPEHLFQRITLDLAGYAKFA